MATSLHTFMNIFGEKFETPTEPIELKKIVIPIIQRDYAQGRLGDDVQRVRSRFLDALYEAVTEQPIILDFVYGDINEKGIMTPLDGQQRLTTLFLLHWYAAKRQIVDKKEYSFLENFSYETRYSARDFCSYLINFNPSFDGKISEEIIDQSWYPLDWNNDPTIKAMLVMIDSIHDKFQKVSNLWESLKDNAISFYFLPIRDMGLTDDLYIKMNSRGKPLTLFEHFKAELERKLGEYDKDTANRIINKIDIDWTEMLWRYRGDNNIIDDEFLCYFHFICDVLYYKRNESPQGKSMDEFDLVDEFFTAKSKNIDENISILEQFFDCWCCFDDDNTPLMFFESLFAKEHESGKIKIENRYNIDVFEDCLRNNEGVSQNGKRKFPLTRIVLLYAIVVYLLNRDNISEKNFCRRLRIVNNLIRNSEFEISDSVVRQGGNRMPAILKQVESIIILEKINLTLGNNFNVVQLTEESEKIDWLEKNEEYSEALFELEDHDLLYGQISVIGLNHPEYFKRFKSLFECSWDKIDCALMALGNYVQREKNNWRYQMGSRKNEKAWRNIFHKSAAIGFDNTKECLGKLLAMEDIFTDEKLEKIICKYLKECEANNCYEWRYYYIKYSSFRPGRFGKYNWNNYNDMPYEFIAMYSERNISTNTYQPFLKEIDAQHISKDDYGMYLVYTDKGYYVACENDAFVRYDLNSEDSIVLERLEIEQDEEGIDTEDRILKYREHYGIKAADNNVDVSQELFHLDIRGSFAYGCEEGRKFTVMADSKISMDVADALLDNYRELRDQLIDDGVIKNGIFVEDYTFSSISAAASVVSGRTANGWTEWINDNGVTYQDMKQGNV